MDYVRTMNYDYFVKLLREEYTDCGGEMEDLEIEEEEDRDE